MSIVAGCHSVIFSADPDADRAFFRDVLQFPHVDVGHGWLIFGLPPSEVGVHPAETSGRQEIYLMVDDLAAFLELMEENKIASSEIQEQPWGLLTHITLPGGGELGVYQARHERPANPE